MYLVSFLLKPEDITHRGLWRKPKLQSFSQGFAEVSHVPLNTPDTRLQVGCALSPPSSPQSSPQSIILGLKNLSK